MISEETQRTVATIRNICRTKLQATLARVRNSEPWTVEGQRARARLRSLESILRRLAHECETPAVTEAVEDTIATNAALMPNLDSAGSLN
jgi:hypothetical protein